ncbi:MAG: hypothetical protein WC341_10015 [Bacteroidales bacterium]
MKTKMEIVEVPESQSHNLFGDQSKFASAMKEANHVFVDVRPHTKTSVYIVLHLEPFRYSANTEPVKDMKYLERREVNMLQGMSYTAYYLKAKALADVQRHVENVLQYFFPSLELEGFTLKFYNTEKVQELARWKYPDEYNK